MENEIGERFYLCSRENDAGGNSCGKYQLDGVCPAPPRSKNVIGIALSLDGQGSVLQLQYKASRNKLALHRRRKLYARSEAIVNHLRNARFAGAHLPPEVGQIGEVLHDALLPKGQT